MEFYINDLNISMLIEGASNSKYIDSKKVHGYLKDNSAPVIAVDTLSSTNTVLKRLADANAPDKTILVADNQTNGRGRLGKSFFSPDGSGIYMSLLVRKQFSGENITVVTPAVAVAMYNILSSYADDVKIKWVNDIYVADKKVCGILTESSINSLGNTDYIVIGVGLNLFKPKNNFPTDIANRATCLFNESVDINKEQLIAQIANEIFDIIDNFNINYITERYVNNSWLDGKSVTVIRGNECFEADVIGINQSLELVIRRDNGIVSISSGDVVVKAE